MELNTASWWETLENLSPTAFFVAGGLFAVDTGFMLVDLLGALSISGAVFVLFFVSALIIALVGALGFYPQLADRRPQLALVSMAPIAVAGLALPIVFAWAILASLLEESLPPGSIALAIIVLIFIGLLLFGVASVRTETPSRTGGLLLLALVGTWLAWFAGFGVWGAHDLPGWWSPTFSVVTTSVTLGIGYVLYTAPATG